MKEAILGILKNSTKWIIGVIIIATVILLLAGSVYVLKIKDSSNPNHSSFWGAQYSNTETNMNAQIENKITGSISTRNIVYKENGDYKLDIDLNEKIDEVYNQLNETEEGRRILNYLTGTIDEKKKLLKDMVRAELITQYPDLRSRENMGSEVNDNEIQGVIQFKRKLSESTVKKVESIKKSEDTSVELHGGIVCWGDDFTLGNLEDPTDNYPNKLSERIEKNVYNLGIYNASAEEIAIMAGVEGYSIETYEQEFVIPAAAGSEVNLNVKLRNGDYLDKGSIPFKFCDGSTENKKLECSINGIEGELTYKEGKYFFKRISEGEEQNVETETTIIIKTQSGYTKAMPIIWIGNGNTYINTRDKGKIQNLIDICWDIIKMSPDSDTYIVILPTHYTDSNGVKQKYESNEYETIKKAFMTESGLNQKQILDLRDKINTGNEYDIIVEEIVNCLNENNITTKVQGEYYQNTQNSDIITLSEETWSTDEDVILEYIPLGNALEPAPGTLMWMIKNEDDEIKKASQQYFSIDEAGNIVITNWTRVTTTIENFTDSDGKRDSYIHDEGSPKVEVEYTVNAVKVNYKESTKKYIMPFDYLWTMLVMGDDMQFVRKITDLTLDSQIEATLYDELTIVDNDVVDEYTNQSKTETSSSGGTSYDVHVDAAEGIHLSNPTAGGSGGGVSSISDVDKKNHTKVVTETNKVKYRLTYADIWCLTYKVEGIEKIEYMGEEDNTSIMIGNQETTSNVNKQEILIPSKRSGINIHSTIFTPQETTGNMPMVLMCHGFTGARNGDGDNGGHFYELGNKLAQCGIAAITITFSGCQDSEEDMTKYTLNNMMNDMNSAIEYMKTNYSIDSSKIGVVGHSMGGRIVSDYIRGNNVAAAAIWAPANGDGLSGLEFLGDYNSFYETAKQNGTVQTSGNFNVTLSKEFFEQMENSHPNNNIKSFSGKLLAVYDSKDKSGNGIISANTANAVQEAVNAQGGIFKELNSDHNFQEREGEQIENITAEFLCSAFGIEYKVAETNEPETVDDLYQKDVKKHDDTEWEKDGPATTTTSSGGYTYDKNKQPIKYTSPTTTTTQKYKRTVNHVTTTIIIKSGIKYSEGTPPKVIEKTDKKYTEEEMKTGVFEKPNFVKYYLYCSTARNNISSSTSWLFIALDNNAKTESMVDITKYMLYKVSNRKSYGVKSYDFNSYNESDFKDVTDYIGNAGGIGEGAGEGNTTGESGTGYWNTYSRGGKTYKLYYQNYISDSNNWGIDSNQMCVATAFAICHSGNGGTNNPTYFWGGGGAINGGMTQIPKDASTIISYLQQNNPVIVYARFGKAFLGSPHALVLLDVNSNGEVFVANPYYKADGNGQKAGGWYPLSTILSYPSASSNFAGSSGCATLLR